MGEQLQPLASRLGHRGALFFGSRAMGHRDLMQTGDLDRFEEFAKEDLETCRKIGVLGLSQSHCYVGLAHFWSGRWDEAMSEFAKAAEVEEAGVWEGLDSSCLLRLKAYQGDRGGVLRALRARPRAPPRMPLRRRLSLAAAFLRSARAAELKRAAIWQVLSPLRERSMERRLRRAGGVKSNGTLQMTVEAVEALVMLEMRREAFQLYPQLVEMIRAGNLMPFHCDRLCQTAAGMAAAAGRRWEQAEEHFRTALEQARDLPHRLEQPEVRRFYAMMMLERQSPGDAERARELLAEAVAIYGDLGMPKHVDMAQALLTTA